jgi:sulfur carrier protein
MFVIVNGHTYPMPEIQTLAALLSRLSPAVPFAVACNAEIVPRASYELCPIQPGDRIDIVHPAAGG